MPPSLLWLHLHSSFSVPCLISHISTSLDNAQTYGYFITPYRSKAHYADLIRVYGANSNYFATASGVFMPYGGGDYRGYPMNSRNMPNWKALDDGPWWIRDSTFGEPSGDYTNFCWLAQYGFE